MRGAERGTHQLLGVAHCERALVQLLEWGVNGQAEAPPLTVGTTGESYFHVFRDMSLTMFPPMSV